MAAIFASLRAAFTSGSPVSPEESAARAGEGENPDDRKLIAPEVEELAQHRRVLRSQHAGIARELVEAESAFEQSRAEIAACITRLAERELDAARTGTSAPADGFEAEHQLARAERQGRVAEARAKLYRERFASSQAAIDETTRKLNAAWQEFGAKNYQQALARFREEAHGLRLCYADLLVWSQLFGLMPIPGHLQIEDVTAKGTGRIMVNSSLGSGNHRDRIWGPFTGELSDAIGRLRAELVDDEQPSEVEARGETK